ncbi:MAG: hypothetical protein QOF69_2388, partial [Solirubrobacteraceae bacterium]|nr:hypothetical protein [Solirubrobacteraceae bacterium]
MFPTGTGGIRDKDNLRNRILAAAVDKLTSSSSDHEVGAQAGRPREPVHRVGAVRP